ncbi:MAG: cupin domain-containing protein [Candidatus Obscuribacterales bacterium]|nr:cupin domain-containing protein [Candidatus Obscuribacterales bacterium]
MYQYLSDCHHCQWEKLEIDGVESKTLYVDEQTNARTVETKLSPGAVIPRHSHTHAHETVYVLSGDFIEEGVKYGPGSYFVGKAGVSHGPHKSDNGCLVITHWTGGPIDFVME